MNAWARAFASMPGRGARALWPILLCLVFAACGGERTVEATPTSPPAVQGEAGAADSAPANADAVAAVTPTAPATPTPAAGTITLWHSWAQREGDALAQILDAFRENYPGVTVQTLFVAPDDLLQSYAEAVQAGSGPDLIIAPNWWLDDLVTLGVVQPLDGLIDIGQADTYWPAALDNLRWQGKLYGLPLSYDTVALYYNPSLLPAVPQTTDELLDLAGQPLQGIGLYNNLFHLAWGIPAFGGQIVDDTGKAVLDQNDGAARYLAWLRVLAGTPGSYVDSDYGMLLDRFKKGEYPFFVDGPWALDELKGAMNGSVSVTTLPAGPAGPAQPWLYTEGIFFNPAATPEQQALARLLGSHLTGAESGTVLAQTARLLPANRNANLGNDADLRAFARQAETAQAMPHGAVMDQVWRYGGDMLVRATAGMEDPAAIVTDTTTLINEATGR